MLPTHVGSLPLDTVDVSAPTGVPVLCLHGLFAGSAVFQRLLPLIAERGHPAAALALRGHPPGAPLARPGRVSIRDYCTDAGHAARMLDRPIIIGHSLGGLLALLLATHNLARAAVLVSAAPPRGIPVLHPRLLLRLVRYLPALLLSRPYLPRQRDLDALVFNRVPPPERAALHAQLVPDSGRASLEAALGLFAAPARALRAPLLVVTGDDDRFVPPTVAERIARRYHAPLHVAHGHGHFLFAEPGWEREAAVILDWIGKLPRVLRSAPPAHGALDRRP